MLKLVRKFLTDRSGNFAIMTGLLLPVVLVATGAAVDFGLALNSSQRLGAAANGAVLAALSEVQARTDVNEVMTEDAINELVEQFFLATAANIPFTRLISVTPNSTIDRNTISASMTFKADYDTALMHLFGSNTVPIANQARAEVTLRSFMNINILVDTSQSMGIGATDLDQQKVAQATNCAFACHINQTRGNSGYDLARQKGANMRIDVARNAVVSAIDTMADTEEFEGQISVGLYRFSNSLTEILSPTDWRSDDLDYAKSLASSQIALDMTYGGTNQEEALTQINGRIATAGEGRSEDDRLQYVIVVTDGVESGQAWLPCTSWQLVKAWKSANDCNKVYGWYRHEQAKPNNPSKTYAPHEVNYALNPSACKALRDRGVKIYFIYTEYLEPRYGQIVASDHTRFNFVTNSLFPIIQTRMASCTGSAAQVLKASTPEEIHNAMVQLASRLSSPLRLY